MIYVVVDDFALAIRFSLYRKFDRKMFFFCRAHGHDVLKQKKGHLKKSTAKYEPTPLYAVTEKSLMHHNASVDELAINDKIKKKESKRDFSEVDLPKVSGFTLPSVKGIDGKYIQYEFKCCMCCM